MAYLAVRTVLLNAWLVSDETVLRAALEPAFPNAAFFMLNDSRAIPVRVWAVQYCDECRTKMTPAGSAFVCENCGNTRFRPEGEER